MQNRPRIKFRAYARGCIELCEKSSRSAFLARTKLVEAPKDIKHLEILRPANAPTMKERYEMAIAKERRLEVASQPELSKAAIAKNKKTQGNNEVKDDAEGDEDKKEKAPSKKPKTGYQPSWVVDEEALKNTKALEEDDEVQEGINWSESEPESGDESE